MTESQTSPPLPGSVPILWQHSPLGIAEVSVDGRFISANPALCSILGYTQEELRAMTYLQVTHPSDEPADTKSRALVISGKLDAYTLYKRYLTKIGNAPWVRMHVHPVLGDKGNVDHLVVQVESANTTTSNSTVAENPALKRAVFYENVKWALGLAAGCALAVVGYWKHITELSMLGVAIVGITLGVKNLIPTK